MRWDRNPCCEHWTFLHRYSRFLLFSLMGCTRTLALQLKKKAISKMVACNFVPLLIWYTTGWPWSFTLPRSCCCSSVYPENTKAMAVKCSVCFRDPGLLYRSIYLLRLWTARVNSSRGSVAKFLRGVGEFAAFRWKCIGLCRADIKCGNWFLSLILSLLSHLCWSLIWQLFQRDHFD